MSNHAVQRKGSQSYRGCLLCMTYIVWRIFSRHPLQVFQIGAILLSLSAKAFLIVEVLMEGLLLISVTTNTENLWETPIICIRVVRLSLLWTRCLNCMLTRRKMSDCGYQAFLFLLPSPKECIIDDSSCQDKFLNTKFILIQFLLIKQTTVDFFFLFTSAARITEAQNKSA